MGSHLLLFELSLPVASQQFRPSTTILAASAAFRRGLRVSAADSAERRSSQHHFNRSNRRNVSVAALRRPRYSTGLGSDVRRGHNYDRVIDISWRETLFLIGRKLRRYQPRRAYQRSRRGYSLLLSHAEIHHVFLQQRFNTQPLIATSPSRSAERFSERFIHEARSIAALNHTNACHLYDVGPDYLVLELIEGETLHGPMSFQEALPIIRQLIDGIEAAHERNIVHRDLKPANIKITPDGVVKILDFGLAKASAPEPDSDPESSPTETIGSTQAGTILGTAAYMSPEQARGKTADRRVHPAPPIFRDRCDYAPI
jgi:serine/threonine protein kinase